MGTFKFKGKTDEIQGVIFEKNGYSFNGSKVDRQFSFSKIHHQLQLNEQKYSPNAVQTKQTPNNQPSTQNILTGVLKQWQKQTDYQNQKDKKAARLKQQKKKRGYRM